MTSETQRRVVCAAYKMKDGLVVTGVRHLSPDMQAVLYQLYGEDYVEHIDPLYRKGGFIDQLGNYLTRAEAWEIADKAGQIVRPSGLGGYDTPRKSDIGDGGLLVSENLY
jgi:hypothetical protein